MSTKTIRKTQTRRIDGQTYQIRLIACGLDRRAGCNTCQTVGGHVAVYADGGTVDGKRKWRYVGVALPTPGTDYRPPLCAAPGCTSPTTGRNNAQYCSPRCRVAANRASKKDPQ